MSALSGLRRRLLPAGLVAVLGAGLIVIALHGHGMGKLVVGGAVLGIAAGWLTASFLLRNRPAGRSAAVLTLLIAAVGATVGAYAAREPVALAAPQPLPTMAVRPAHAKVLTSMGLHGRIALVAADQQIRAYSLGHPERPVWTVDSGDVLALTDDLVVTSEQGGVVSRRITTGAVRWRRAMGRPFLGDRVGVFGDVLLLRSGNRKTALAIDLRTGRIAWRRRGTPTVGSLMVTTKGVDAPSYPVYRLPDAAAVLPHGPYAAIERRRGRRTFVTVIRVDDNTVVLRRTLPWRSEYFVSPTHLVYDPGDGRLVATPLAGAGPDRPVPSIQTTDALHRTVGLIAPGPLLPDAEPLPKPWADPILVLPWSGPSPAFLVDEGRRVGLWDSGSGRVTALPTYDGPLHAEATGSGDYADLVTASDAVGEDHDRLDLVHGGTVRSYQVTRPKEPRLTLAGGLVCVDGLGCSPVSDLA